MTRFTHFAATLAVAGMSMTGAVLADDAGKDEYMTYCATCHGAMAVGDGPMAEFMSVKMPDLTRIAEGNDGNFPVLDVVHVVDGRTGVMAHGAEMPVWGDQFSAEANGGMEGDYSDVYEVRGRILSLVYYIESIQK